MESVILTSPATRITPIIKVVGESCNLKCSYCYYNHKTQTPDKNKKMTKGVLERFISQYLSIFDGPIVFVWHGGEPMLAGLDFYEKVLCLEEKYKNSTHIITNAIQTNGTLIDAKWAEFFMLNNFRVSLSIDGASFIHNKYRTTLNGQGTSHLLERSIKVLRSVGIEPNVLQTITKSSLAYLQDSFDYFVDILQIHNWGINVFRDVEQTNPIMKYESINNEDYYRLITTLFEIWLKRNDPSIIIREIDDYALVASGKTPDTCSMSGNCSSFITIDWDGTVYPCCDNIISDADVVPVNINDYSLIEILNCRQRLLLAERINTLPFDCKECDYLYGCYNGCTYHREKGINPYCKATKDIIKYFREKLSNC